MLTFVAIVVGCLVVGIAVYGILSQTGFLPAPGDAPPGTDRTAPGHRPGVYRAPAPREVSLTSMSQWPQGCLIALILAALLWFALWGAVLVLALRFLSSPFEG